MFAFIIVKCEDDISNKFCKLKSIFVARNVVVVIPAADKSIFDSHTSPFTYLNVLFPDTSIPAPYVCVWFVALLANNILWSLISNVDEFIIVLLPSTCNPPRITTIPVLSPTAAGSIINVDGPFIWPEVVILPVSPSTNNVVWLAPLFISKSLKFPCLLALIAFVPPILKFWADTTFASVILLPIIVIDSRLIPFKFVLLVIVSTERVPFILTFPVSPSTNNVVWLAPLFISKSLKFPCLLALIAFVPPILKFWADTTFASVILLPIIVIDSRLIPFKWV